MKYCLITFRSVTPAQRGEHVLRRAGIDCTMSRTPKKMEELGCGYSLRLRPVDGAGAVSILRQQQISYRKVYLLDDSGRMEEMDI